MGNAKSDQRRAKLPKSVDRSELLWSTPPARFPQRHSCRLVESRRARKPNPDPFYQASRAALCAGHDHRSSDRFAPLAGNFSLSDRRPPAWSFYQVKALHFLPRRFSLRKSFKSESRTKRLVVGTRFKMSELGVARCPDLSRADRDRCRGERRQHGRYRVVLVSESRPTALHRDHPLYLAVNRLIACSPTLVAGSSASDGLKAKR